MYVYNIYTCISKSPNIWNMFPSLLPFTKSAVSFALSKRVAAILNNSWTWAWKMPHRLAILGPVKVVPWIMIVNWKKAWSKATNLGETAGETLPCYSYGTKVHPIEVWWWMALLILLSCLFFQPTWTKKPQDSQRNTTCKLTTSDLHEFLNKPNKTQGFSTGYPHSNPPQTCFKWTLRREVHQTSNGKINTTTPPLWILPALRRCNW